MANHYRLTLARIGIIALCASVLLVSLATSSAFASTRVHNATATPADSSSSLRIKHVVELGTFDAGGITMIDSKVGWTFTDKVQRTSDGGKTWQIVARGDAQEYIGALEVLDENITWYLTYDRQTFVPTALHRTTDGGQTWTRFDWIDPTQFMTGISILDGQAAWVNTSDSSGVDHLYLVGGSNQNWQAVTSPGPNGANSIFFLSQEVGWATVVTQGDFNQIWTLYTTRDGGQTWVQQDLALPANVPATAVATNINFIGFGDSLEGYMRIMLGDPASFQEYSTQIYRTLDGGNSWQPYGDPVPSGPDENIGFIFQIDQWHTPASWFAFIIINGQVGLGTLVAGKWTIQHIALPKNGNFLTVLTSREMFVSGPNADFTGQDLYKTQDGATNWRKIITVPN